MNPITQKANCINLTKYDDLALILWLEQPDLLAINILLTVLYWYRPLKSVIGYKQKFRSDKLQKSNALRKLFGFSKERVKQAFDLLVDLGLITREFRNIKTED